MRGFGGVVLLAAVLAAGCSRSRPIYEYEPPVTTVHVGSAPATTPVGPGNMSTPASSTPTGVSTVSTTVPRPSVWKTRNSP